MTNVNIFTIIGRLTADAEGVPQRFKQMSVATLPMAC